MARINVNLSDDGEGKVGLQLWEVEDLGDIAVKVGGRAEVLIAPGEVLNITLDGKPFVGMRNAIRLSEAQVTASIDKAIDAADPPR